MSDEVRAPQQGNPYSTLMAVVGGGVALALVILSIGFVARGDGSGSSAGAATVPIELSDFKIGGTLSAAPGDVTLAVTNAGTGAAHNLVVEQGGKEVGRTADLSPGKSENLVLKGLAAGEYTLYCAVAGHREAGMEATLTVAEGAGGAAAGSMPGMDHSGSSGSEPDYKKMDADMMASFEPFVKAVTTGKPNTKGLGGADLAPKVEKDGTKVWDLTAAITDWEVAPGQTVKAWTYNGTVPGPTIRGEVGDKIKVVLHNELPMGTDIHMHGMILPNDQDGVAPVTQKLIEPGQTFTYSYTVTKPAIAMYHPHASGVMQVPNGMWGAMIFSPKGGGGKSDYVLPKGKTISGVQIPADLVPAQEHNMVLNDAGVIGLSLNGKSFPATEAYGLKVGDWMVVNYYNEGQMSHPMHLHQFPQLVVARDGIPLDNPYFADTINVAPGERFTVLFHAERPGVWVWHCHILNHAERDGGMFGMVTAIKVDA